jgi:hypothetical protein
MYDFVRLRRTIDGPRLDARPGAYFDSLVTSEALEREFVNAQAHHPDTPVELGELPRRQWIHQQLMDYTNLEPSAPPTPVLDGRFRSAALSVAMTMIFGDHGQHSALVPRRSHEVQTHPRFHHVIPAGIFSPLDYNWHGWQNDFSVRNNVLREYAEEVFGYKELELNSGHLPSGFRQIPPIVRLVEAVDRGDVMIRYCGVGVPLLTLRPEIYVLLYVPEEAWFDEQIGLAMNVDRKRPKLNWEYKPDSGRRGARLDLDDNFEPIDDRAIIRTHEMVPHAAAALKLATGAARHVAK